MGEYLAIFNFMTNLIQNRLNEYLKVKSLTNKDFELMCGLSNGAAAKLSEKSRKTTFDRLVERSDLNVDWLLTGEGEMLSPNGLADEVENFSKEELRIVSDSLRDGRFRMVPLINIDSVGGVHSSNIVDPSEQYVIKMMPFTEAREGDVAILQSGNSMYPTIPSGSALLIRKVEDWREYFGYGNIYVLWLRDGRRITKEVRRYDPDPKNYVWCVSYNPDVADEELPCSMIQGVWKVIKYVADFGW